MRIPHPGGGGFNGGGAGTVLTDIAAGFAFIVIFVVVVGLIFIAVRFMLAMTKAANLYVAQNSRPADVSGTAAAPTRQSPSRFPWGGDPDPAPTAASAAEPARPAPRKPKA